MHTTTEIIKKILRQHIFVFVDYPSVEEVVSKRLQYISKFDDYPHFITFDPDIWQMFSCSEKAKEYIIEPMKFIDMQVVLVSDIDTYILPFDERLQNVVNHVE